MFWIEKEENLEMFEFGKINALDEERRKPGGINHDS